MLRSDETMLDGRVPGIGRAALVLGLAVATLPGALSALLTIAIMGRLALTPQWLALLHPPYPIGLVLGALPAAALAARYGKRRAFLIALALVGALSVAAALPLPLWPLLGLRLLQGMASAGLLAAGLALVRPVFGAAGAGLGYALAVMAGVAGAALLPPLLGVGYSLLGVPGMVGPALALTAGALLLCWRTLPAGEPGTGRFDALGAMLALACPGLLLAALYTAPFRPWRGVVLLVLGLLVLGLWVFQQRRRSDPMLPLDLLAVPEFRRGAGTALLGGLAVSAAGLALLPQLSARGLPPDAPIGLLLLAGPVAAALSALTTGLATPWRWTAATGALLVAGGTAALALAAGGLPGAVLVVLVLGAGRGMLDFGVTQGLVDGVPPGRGAAAAGMVVGALSLGAVLAPFATMLLPFLWLGGAMRGGAAGAVTYGLGLATLAALLAAVLAGMRRG
ncbi:MAG: MFS transporter [Roseomonas mucosa]|nr:MFS transporter [Roseomonas mucosa]